MSIILLVLFYVVNNLNNITKFFLKNCKTVAKLLNTKHNMEMSDNALVYMRDA